jgi:NADPH:quinone reductase-like Zn-dependent oxidoreductase/acyl carrier protein
LAAARGLSLKRLEGSSAVESGYSLYQAQWQPQPLAEQQAGQARTTGAWLIFADNQGAAQGLAERLHESGESCVLVVPGAEYQTLASSNGGRASIWLNPSRPEDFHQLVRDVNPAGHPLRGIVHLWSLDAGGDLQLAQEQGSLSVMHLVQALSQAELALPPRLWLVTRGVVYPDEVAGAPDPETMAANVAQSPLWGLGGVIALEHPELRCARVDLSPLPQAGESESLWAEIAADGDEDQLALRDGKRYVARLAHVAPEATSAARPRPTPAEPGQGYQLTVNTPGILDDLFLETRPRRRPEPGKIEIEVRAAGLNFLDVMKTLGIYPGLDPSTPAAIGAECAGRVTAVGEGVTGFRVGDDVLAITPSLNKQGLFAAYATLPAQMAVAMPAHLSYADAATLPIAFLTAHYALNHLGRMAAGERVLIHSATGGVGLAAVQLAQRAGAEIFATAGNEQKRDYLRSLSIQHVMDSRSLDFAVEIMDKTGGRGVDLVLNSLSGEAIRQSLAALAPYGRFLEIGKRDIYQNSPLGLEPFKKNLSFFAIDLARIVEERPALVMTLLREVMAYVAAGDLQPLPAMPFPIGQAAEAFRSMAHAKHMGKIVVTFPAAGTDDVQLPAIYSAEAARPIVAGATYLITGGLGGLGLLVADWLAQRGARHLVLLGRSEPGTEAREAIAALESAGARVVVAQADVARSDQLATVLAQIRQDMPPLRGVVHAAGLLADSTFLQLDRQRLFQALAPKVDGAWNLHTLTAGDELDFFVLFSSIASLLGSPGQANYAAGNAFLDSLAHMRRALGLTALSINWGPWSQIGLAAAAANRGDRLAQRGIGSITPSQGMAALEKLMAGNAVQVAVMPFDARQWCEVNPAAATSSLLKAAVVEQGSAAPDIATAKEDIRAQLLAADPGRPRRLLLESHLREQIAHVLRLSPSRIESHQPLKSLGLDSLMAVELRNRLEATLGVSLSATLVFNYPTVAVMAPHIANKMGIPLDGMATTETAAPIAQAKQPGQMKAPLPKAGDALTSAEIGQLSDEDAEAMLLKELEDIDF